MTRHSVVRIAVTFESSVPLCSYPSGGICLGEGSERRAQLYGLHGRTDQEVWVKRVGMNPAEACALLRATTLHGNIPEPLRMAHLIAGRVTMGRSRGRA